MLPHRVKGSRSSGWTEGAWATDPFGTLWRIGLRLDDHTDDSSEAMISIVIDKEEQQDVKEKVGATTFTIILRDANQSVVKEITLESSDISFVCKGFIERSRVLEKDNNILVGGGFLHFDLVIQPKISVKFSSLSSRGPLVNNILSLLDTSNTMDVSFLVSGQHVFAHKLMLTANAPLLASFVAEKDPSSIVIEGVSPEVFRCMIRYFYGGGAPDKDFILANGKEIIETADKYGVVGLKLETEATLVASHVVNLSNVFDYVLFADAKNCPLLKEYAVAMCIARWKDVIIDCPESFSELSKSPALMREVMLAEYEAMHGTPVLNNGDDVRQMPVFTLLKKLDEKGLDVDGSKEMLLSRLVESSD